VPGATALKARSAKRLSEAFARFPAPRRLGSLPHTAPMKLLTSTLSLKKHQAIAALVTHGVAETADICGITTQKLCRWMKDPVFDAALRAARRADERHQTALLRQDAKGAVVSLLNIMYDARAKPSNRFVAARQVRRIAKAAVEIADFAADVAEMERTAIANAKLVILPAGDSVKSRRTGHGAKFPHRKRQAVIQLFKQHSIGDAARETGIGTQTLYQWMEEPEFDAECRAVERSVFGEAMTLAQQKLGDAITLIRKFARDPATPQATRLKADTYITNEALENAVKDLTARVAEGERAKGTPVATDEPEDTGKMIGRNLRQRLRQLKALLPVTRRGSFEYVHARDGRAVGWSVIGAQGKQVWSRPAEACQVGDLVPVVAA